MIILLIKIVKQNMLILNSNFNKMNKNNNNKLIKFY